ncbi:MAG TPA: hypothetical protein PK586_06750 [Casimicrobium sp.]|nr:hypothetical protein [Casimicrobium sp.]
MSSKTILRGLRIATLSLLVLPMLAFGQPAPTPIAVQSVTVAPSIPQEYQPFTLTVTFSKPYCFAVTDAPLFSKVSLADNSVMLLLSHLGKGENCTNNKSVSVPGLPAGNFAITVGVTGSYWKDYPAGTRESVPVEQGTVAITVAKATADKWAMRTTVAPELLRDQSGLILTYARPIVTATAMGFTSSLIAKEEDVEFWVWANRLTHSASATAPPPLTAVRLYALKYPTSLSGTYFTTSIEEVTKLSQGGFTLERFGSTDQDEVKLYVLPTTNGACPLGAVPVYRLFNQKAPAHRYVSSFDTYNVLAANGFIGEGMVFCAPRP